MSISAMPWVKLYRELLDDPKMLRISRTARLRFIELILMAGECDSDGALINGGRPMTTKDIAARLRSDIRQVEKDIESLVEVACIERKDGVIFLQNFSKRQGNSHEFRREMWASRQRKHRENKLDSENVTRDTIDCHASRVEKSREEREKSKRGVTPEMVRDIPAQAPDTTSTPSSVNRVTAETRAPEPPPTPAPRPRDLLFDAIAEVTDSNAKLMGSRIAKCAKDLRKVDATPDQVRQVAAWYSVHDWRGQRGDKLTFAVLQEVWDAGIRNLQPVRVNGKTNEPAGFDGIREAARRHGITLGGTNGKL